MRQLLRVVTAGLTAEITEREFTPREVLVVFISLWIHMCSHRDILMYLLLVVAELQRINCLRVNSRDLIA